MPLGVVPDAQGGDEHSEALEQVTQRVDVRSIQVHALLLFLVLMAVVVAVVVGVVMAVVMAVVVLMHLDLYLAALIACMGAMLMVCVSVAVPMIMSMSVVVSVASVTDAVTVCLQHLCEDEIDRHTNQRRDGHDLAVDHSGVDDAVNSLIQQPRGDAPDDENASECAEDLSAVITKRHCGRTLLTRQPDGKQTDEVRVQI
mmetsp:Transcript_32019/g.79394  ORF Transcript_32019/g.79394 Transcript_32019/m.79394 type:complete len:200 (-) Transcript_32019:2-601(-)